MSRSYHFNEPLRSSEDVRINGTNVHVPEGCQHVSLFPDTNTGVIKYVGREGELGEERFPLGQFRVAVDQFTKLEERVNKNPLQ